MSKKKSEVRKELANELRKAHFYVGFDQNQPKKSIYRRDYVGYPFDANNLATKDPNLRASHYSLGNDPIINSEYQSIHKTDYLPPPNNLESAKLNDEKKNDLRNHHFLLGFSNGFDQSEAKSQYTKKPIDPATFEDKSNMRNFLRKHNHDFGDKNNYYNSVYDNYFNSIANLPKEAFHQGKSKDQIMKEIVELRKTNLVLGSDASQFQTSNQNDFVFHDPKKTVPFDPKLKDTNYILGTDAPEYTSHYAKTYDAKVPEKNELKKELLKDLRATHFTVGNDLANYSSEHALKFQEPNKESYKTLERNPDLQKNHYVFGDPSLNDPKFYQSMYSEVYNRQLQPLRNDKLRDDRSDRASNIVFGTDKSNTYLTEHHSKYYQMPYSKNNLNEKFITDLKTHHNVLGTDNNDWVSETHKIFVDKSKIQDKNALDEALKNDLRRNHFEYGFQKNTYESSNQEIGSKQGRPNKLGGELEKDLRQHHFSENGGDREWGTIYREQYIWKQPTDD